METEWQLLGLGFTLKETGEQIRSVTWVDNVFILADNIEQYTFMVQSLTSAMLQRFGWVWKDSSLELMAIGHELPFDEHVIECGGLNLRYKVLSRIEALGGLLDKDCPTQALRQHRFSKGEAAYHTYRKQFMGKAPVSVKLAAYRAVPRSVALYLCSVMHWNAKSLMGVVRWERRMLR